MQVKKKLETILFVIFAAFIGSQNPSLARAEYNYQLYKNFENFGILIFPKDQIFEKLDEYIQQIGFDPVESGQALMRFGSKNENQTYMMPEEVQRRYSMDRFIVLQVITHQNILVGVFDPEWGLILPSAIFRLNEVKQNIPKTLNIFRKHLKKRETQRQIPENHKTKRLLATNAVIISTWFRFMNKPH